MKASAKQIRKMTSLAKSCDEESEYIMLFDGTALCALYADGKTTHLCIDRRGQVVEKKALAIPLGKAL